MRGGAFGKYGGRRGAYRVLHMRAVGKRSLFIPWRRWEGNIKIDLREVG
jgi:hypothetical protein